MAIFTLEEAARFSGRSPREVRLLIERGEIPGRRRAGRWMVTSHDLERSLLKRGYPESDPHPPVGADPDDPFAPSTPPDPDDREARMLERVRSLERELAEVRGELAKADARVIDLERAALEVGRADPEPGSVPESKSARGTKPPPKGKGPIGEQPGGAAEDMRQALTPLFRPEGKPPRKRSPRAKPPGGE